MNRYNIYLTPWMKLAEIITTHFLVIIQSDSFYCPRMRRNYLRRVIKQYMYILERQLQIKAESLDFRDWPGLKKSTQRNNLYIYLYLYLYLYVCMCVCVYVLN